VTNRANKYAKHRREQLISLFGGRCQNKKCGSTCELQFAHIKPTRLSGVRRGRGRKEHQGDIAVHPGSYVLLCKSCHEDFDAGRLTLKNMRVRNQKIYK